MAMESQLPSPPRPGGDAAAGQGSGLAIGLISIGILIGGLLLGAAGGVVWSAIAPRVAFAVISAGSANVVNPETTGFIAGDLGYCLVAAVGGLTMGLVGYLAGVRRHGPVPMLAILAGACGAAYIERRVGQAVGLNQFNRLLATGHPGTILSAPLVLGAQGPNAQALWAMAFWPMLACLMAGGLTLRTLVRDRRLAAAMASAAPVGPATWPDSTGRHEQAAGTDGAAGSDGAAGPGPGVG